MKTPEERIRQIIEDHKLTFFYPYPSRHIVLITEIAQAYHAQFEGEVIHAKALRKKGTDRWYGINELAGDWYQRKLPDLWHYEFHVMEGIEFVSERNLPSDAELVEIEIRVKP